jgi:tetratricopeptide (TPR) repeat protein
MRAAGFVGVVVAVAGAAACGSVGDGTSEAPAAQRVAPARVEALPELAVQPRTLPSGPTLTLEHEHVVDPVPDLEDARSALSELDEASVEWVTLQHRIALAVSLRAESPAEAAAAYARAAQSPVVHAYPSADELLFDYAMLAWQAGAIEDGKNALLDLIRNHPTSPFVMNAYAAFADHMFSTGNLEAAIKLYDKIRQFGEPDVTAYATYRLAWCHLSSDPADGRRALELFVHSMESLEQPTGWARDLQRASLEGAVLAYADVGRPDRAKAFFARIVRDTDIPIETPLRLLAEAYAEVGDSDAVSTVHAEVRCGCSPMSESSCQ